MGALDEGHFIGQLHNGVKLNLRYLEEEEEENEEENTYPITTTSGIEEAVKILLEGLGEDSNREGLQKTPLRVAKALAYATKGYRQKVKDIVQGALFPEAGLDSGFGQAGGGAGGLVVVRDLDLFSYCELCLLPFQVKCHVGYVPSGKRVVGLSKLSRVADVFAKRLQDPKRLADEVCLALQNGIRPAGVAVVLQCSHIQFPAVEGGCLNQTYHPTKVDMQGWLKVSVCSGSGVFENKNGDVWADFLALLKFRGVEVDTIQNQSYCSQYWCPSRSLDVVPCNGHKDTWNPSNGRIVSKAEHTWPAMLSAVTEIITSLGEDPSRKELVGTPHRFVQWLMSFKCSNMEMKLKDIDYGRTSQLVPRSHMNGNGVQFHGNQNELQAELNLPFWSQCEHHLLPFHGVVHIGYFHCEGGEPIGKSRLQSIVQFYGSKLQVQERLTRQIAETVSSGYGEDVMVVVEASHICMISRGIEKVGSSTATIATMGRFTSDPSAKASFLQTVSKSTASGVWQSS